MAVIQQWVSENNPKNIDELLRVFPQEIRKGGLFFPVEEAKAIYKRQSIYRHFLGEDEILTFSDSSQYAISNQWGKGNIEKFINQAKKNEYEIEEIR